MQLAPIITRLKTLVSITKGVVHLGMDQAGNNTLETALPATVADAGVFTPTRLANYQ